MTSNYQNLPLRKYDPSASTTTCMILDHRMPRLALYFKPAGGSRDRVAPPDALRLYAVTLDAKDNVTGHRPCKLSAGIFYFERECYEIVYADKLIFRVMPVTTQDGEPRMAFGELAEPAPFTLLPPPPSSKK